MCYDVAIIGGGVVGCSIARELSKYCLKTLLIEKQSEVGFGTSKANSGIIHAGHHSSPDTLKGSLVVEGNLAVRQLAKELPFGFRSVGELVVAKSEEDRPVLEQLKLQGEQKGIPGLEIWEQERLRTEEPALSEHLIAGLYAPTAGVVNPYEMVFFLMESAKKNGVEFLVDSPVLDIVPKKDHLVLHTPKNSLKARFVINAAGVFADMVSAMVGIDDFQIFPRKGEEYMLDKSLKGLVKRIIFPCPSKISKGTLIIPTVDHTIMVGPTAEDGVARDDLSTSEQGAKKIFDAVSTMAPSISPRNTIAEFAGLRAVSSTNDFIIGPTKVKGFINVAGIQSPGLTAAPAIARLVTEILADEGLKLRKNSKFVPTVDPVIRFSALDDNAKADRIEDDPLSARIVCRCEEVTEREILEAIDHGAKTLDGIKFRVRAGMGRCQGGFCTWRLMQILSERLGISISELTKRGGESWLVLNRDDNREPNQ